MLEFDSSTGKYLLFDTYYDVFYPGGSSTLAVYDQSQKVGVSSAYETREQAYYTSWNNKDDSYESLTLLKPESGNPKIELTYVSYGMRRIWSPETPYEWRSYFYYGLLTPESAIPTAGIAKMSGIADGTFFEAGVPYRLAGTSALTADFAAGTVSAALDLTGSTNIVNAAPFGNVQFAGVGSIGSNGYRQFFGSLTSSAPNYSGHFEGNFFGPAANEYGFEFVISHAEPGASRGGGGAGVAVGK